MADHTVKLTDYTLALKSYVSPVVFHNPNYLYTCTHRPLEIWLKQDYDLSADIWALGVTLLEMALQEAPFPCQSTETVTNEHHQTFIDRSVNCLAKWNQLRGKYLGSPEDHLEIPLRPSQYREPRPVTCDQTFLAFILRVLHPFGKSRPSCTRLLEDEYFAIDLRPEGESKTESSLTSRTDTTKSDKPWPYKLTSCTVLSSSRTFVSEIDLTILRRILDRHCKHSDVVEASLILYRRCLSMPDSLNRPNSLLSRGITKHDRLLTCLFMMSKTLLLKPIIAEIPLTRLIQIERIICVYLSYRLC